MSNNAGKKGIGIVGYGGFGEACRRAWDEMDNVHVTAICDSDSTRAAVGLAYYQQIGPMLADPNVDIVSIATPPNSHKDIAVMTLEAGKHALVEKPLALSEDDAKLVKDAAERTKRVATVDFMLRYNPIVEMVGKIIETGVLGKLRRLDLRNYAMLDQTPEGHWFWNPKISGRIFLEHGVHFFDLAHYFTGSRAAQVFGVSAERKPGIEDRVFAAVRYENDIIGTFWHSFSRPRVLETTTYHLAFDLGEVDMFGWIPLDLNIWGWTNKEGLEVLYSLHPNICMEVDRMESMKAQSSEFLYDVEYDIRAKISIGRPKMQVYSENLRSIMGDIAQAIDNPSHKLRVTLDDGIEAVRVAEMATKFIHPEEELAPKMEAEVLRAQS